MKPRFDGRIIRPGGRRYDIHEKTDLTRTFQRIRKERAEQRRAEEQAEQERTRKVRKIA